MICKRCKQAFNGVLDGCPFCGEANHTLIVPVDVSTEHIKLPTKPKQKTVKRPKAKKKNKKES